MICIWWRRDSVHMVGLGVANDGGGYWWESSVDHCISSVKSDVLGSFSSEVAEWFIITWDIWSCHDGCSFEGSQTVNNSFLLSREGWCTYKHSDDQVIMWRMCEVFRVENICTPKEIKVSVYSGELEFFAPKNRIHTIILGGHLRIDWSKLALN